MTTLNHDIQSLRKRAIELRNKLHNWVDASASAQTSDLIERAMKTRDLLGLQLETTHMLELDIIRTRQMEEQDRQHLLDHANGKDNLDPMAPWELEILGYARLDSMRFQVDCRSCRSIDPAWTPHTTYETLQGASEDLIEHITDRPDHHPIIERV